MSTKKGYKMYQFELKNQATFTQNHTQLLPALVPAAAFVTGFAVGATVANAVVGDNDRSRRIPKNLELKQKLNISTLSLSELLDINHQTLITQNQG